MTSSLRFARPLATARIRPTSGPPSSITRSAATLQRAPRKNTTSTPARRSQGRLLPSGALAALRHTLSLSARFPAHVLTCAPSSHLHNGVHQYRLHQTFRRTPHARRQSDVPANDTLANDIPANDAVRLSSSPFCKGVVRGVVAHRSDIRLAETSPRRLVRKSVVMRMADPDAVGLHLSAMLSLESLVFLRGVSRREIITPVIRLGGGRSPRHEKLPVPPVDAPPAFFTPLLTSRSTGCPAATRRECRQR